MLEINRLKCPTKFEERIDLYEKKYTLYLMSNLLYIKCYTKKLLVRDFIATPYKVYIMYKNNCASLVFILDKPIANMVSI